MSGAVAIHAHAWRKALTIDDAQRGGCDAASSAEASARGAARRAAPVTRVTRRRALTKWRATNKPKTQAKLI